MKKRLLLVTRGSPMLGQLLARVSNEAVETVVWTPEDDESMPQAHRFDVALIDTESLGLKTVGVLRVLRSMSPMGSLLACAGSDVGVDAVLAYELGVDDYFSKSIDPTINDVAQTLLTFVTQVGSSLPVADFMEAQSVGGTRSQVIYLSARNFGIDELRAPSRDRRGRSDVVLRVRPACG